MELLNKIFKGGVVSLEPGAETMPWPRQAMESHGKPDASKTRMHGRLDMHFDIGTRMMPNNYACGLRCEIDDIVVM